MNKVLVIDDEANIVGLLRDYLQQAGYQTLTASNAETGLHILRRESPDLLVLDLGLPDQDGWDLTRLLRGDRGLCRIPIIMLTARVGEEDKVVGLELGADDYITKPFNPREVVARVRAVLRRVNPESFAQTQKIHLGDLELDQEGHSLAVKGKTIELTPTEFQLLAIFMENPGHTYTREELLEKTLGYSYEGSGRTLDTHIRNLRRKVEPEPDRPVYIETVHRIGYRFARFLDIQR
ncbi:MAG: response regulator transcription factor [Anaerolineaceae bacterium]|nr:response regulator transcription factor [Anaerolineaceae bacterium]